jgi:hypothetical protein
MTERDLSRWPVWLGISNTVLLLTIIWGTSAWKTQIDEQMQPHRQQIASLALVRIHPEADRRIAVIEREGHLRDREIAQLRDDMIKRLDRMEAKLDRLKP